MESAEVLAGMWSNALRSDAISPRFSRYCDTDEYMDMGMRSNTGPCSLGTNIPGMAMIMMPDTVHIHGRRQVTAMNRNHATAMPMMNVMMPVAINGPVMTVAHVAALLTMASSSDWAVSDTSIVIL